MDKDNKNHAWQDAIKKELDTLHDMGTWTPLKAGERPPKEYTFVPVHWVFDVKFDLRRKARLVAGGNWLDPGAIDTFSGVVSIENVRIAMFLSELNNMELEATDIGNAFLNAEPREKVYTKGVPGFGPLEGKTLIIDKALYGLRGASAAFHEHLSYTLANELGFKPSYADPDLWIKDRGY